MIVVLWSLQVRHLRNKCHELDIEVDGGVGPSTIDACAEVSSLSM